MDAYAGSLNGMEIRVKAGGNWRRTNAHLAKEKVYIHFIRLRSKWKLIQPYLIRSTILHVSTPYLRCVAYHCHDNIASIIA